MSVPRRGRGVTVLRWSLGLVVLWESCQFVLSAPTAHQLRGMGLPTWIAPILGGAEMVAAILFLIARLRRMGGYLLLTIFAIAASLHILHGRFDVGPLIVYSAAVLVCTSEGSPLVARGFHE
jgi:uncharacterized membrane protein YphA (DoxX/SURF4 family)